MEQTSKVASGIADYLKHFDTSPHSYPAKDRKVVEGSSTLKGSWRASSKLPDRRAPPSAW